ncbi:MlaD family protein [Propionivibrio sp.]|uniref:MlaD family protein n=1 Tax=Propionivibrio sp. TaxID=2212460 RepID=UPI0026056355|nr:MlaD family protein [Propionivibrio sp.]
MENRSHALLAGLFALCLGFSAVAALWWFGGKQELSNEFLVTTKKNISGLSQQGQVRYRGVRVGKVESIELDPSDFSSTLIRISIMQTIPVTRGTTAKLGFQGVTGIAHVLLEDAGKDKTPLTAVRGELTRIPMQDSLIQELSDVGGETLRNARDFLLSANQLLSPENRQSIAKTLANLEATTENSREATAQLRQLLTSENIRLMSSSLARIDQAAGQAGPFFSEARDLVARLQSVSEKLDTTLGDPTGGGAGALMPRFNDLISELSANSHQLRRVLQMLEDSPQSLIFGRQKALPGPGEAGFIAPDMIRRQP